MQTVSSFVRIMQCLTMHHVSAYTYLLFSGIFTGKLNEQLQVYNVPGISPTYVERTDPSSSLFRSALLRELGKKEDCCNLQCGSISRWIAYSNDRINAAEIKVYRAVWNVGFEVLRCITVLWFLPGVNVRISVNYFILLLSF